MHILICSIIFFSSKDVSKQLQDTRVFQLQFPAAPLSHFFVVGDPNVARTIITDPLSTKPGLYKLMRKISGGKSILTLNDDNNRGKNAHGWYAKRKATSPAFSSNHVKRMTRVALEKAEAWIRNTLLASTIDNTSSFDVSKEMLGFVLAAISETAFEYEMSRDEVEMFREELLLALVEFTR